jgi:hypothetical protein
MAENGLSTDQLANDPATHQNDPLRIVQEELFKMQQYNQSMMTYFQQMLQSQSKFFEEQWQKQNEQIQKQNDQIQKLNEDNKEFRQSMHDPVRSNNVDKTRELKEVLQIPTMDYSAQINIKENQIKKQKIAQEEVEVNVNMDRESEEEKAADVRHMTSAEKIQLANYQNRIKTVELYNCSPKQVTTKNVLHSSLAPNHFRDNLDAVMETTDNTAELKKLAKEIRFEVFQQKKGSMSSVISEENDITNRTKITGIHEEIYRLIDELPPESKNNLGLSNQSNNIGFIIRGGKGLNTLFGSIIKNKKLTKEDINQNLIYQLNSILDTKAITMAKYMEPNIEKIEKSGQERRNRPFSIYIEFSKTDEELNRRFSVDESTATRPIYNDSSDSEQNWGREIIAWASPFIRKPREPRVLKKDLPKKQTSQTSGWNTVGPKGKITFADVIKNDNSRPSTNGILKQQQQSSAQTDISQLCNLVKGISDSIQNMQQQIFEQNCKTTTQMHLIERLYSATGTSLSDLKFSLSKKSNSLQ